MDIDKDLVAPSATPLVLAVVADGDTHGHAILQRFGEICRRRPPRPDAMLYPVLHRLERHGHIESSWGTSETGLPRKHDRTRLP